MAIPTPPFNGIQLSYTCQCCGDIHSGTPARIPSDIVQGNVLLEKHVCADCQTTHAANLKSNFWGEMATKPQPGQCGGCNNALAGQRSHPVHERLNADGTWKMGRICTDCFTEYRAVCAENMKSK